MDDEEKTRKRKEEPDDGPPLQRLGVQLRRGHVGEAKAVVRHNATVARRRQQLWQSIEEWQPWLLIRPRGQPHSWERLIFCVTFGLPNVPIVLIQAMCQFAFGDHRRLLNAILPHTVLVLAVIALTCRGVDGGDVRRRSVPNWNTLEDNPGQFAACDCSGSGIRYVGIDLTQTEECVKEEGDFEDVYNQRVLILQTDGHEEIEVLNCEVRYSKEITRCGFDHGDFGSRFVVRDKIIYPKRDECYAMAATNLYHPSASHETLLGGQPKVPLADGVWGWTSFYSHGSRDHQGNCQWDSWWFKGTNYKRSYEETVVKARYRRLKGLLDRKTGTITISNGIRTDFAASQVDDVEGLYVWNKEDVNCTDKLSMIYDDFAAIHRVRDERRKSSDKFDGSVLIINDKETRQSGGFVISKERDSCLPDCHRTHIGGLVACMDPHRVRHKLTYRPGEHPDLKMLQAALSYTQLSNTFRTDAKFTDVAFGNCLTRQEGAEHQLADLAGNDNVYALRNLRIDGIGPQCRQWLNAGATGYVASCPLRNVTMIPYANCTSQIPVVYAEDISNDDAIVRFVDPISNLIQEMPTMTACSPVMPVKWHVAGVWYCSTPVTHVCEAPYRLSVDSTTGLATTQDDTDGDSVGTVIYSEEQLAQNRQFMSQQGKRRPIMEHIADRAAENTHPTRRGQPIHFGLPLSLEDLDNLGYEIALRIMPIFTWIGQWYTILIGILFCLGCVKLITGIVLRLSVLYKRKGFGPWLFTALWSTLFHLWGLPWKVVKSTYKGTMGDFDKALKDLEPATYEQLQKHVAGLVKAQEAQYSANLHRDSTIQALVNGIAQQDGPFRDVANRILADMMRPPVETSGAAHLFINDLRAASAPRGSENGEGEEGANDADAGDSLLP